MTGELYDECTNDTDCSFAVANSNCTNGECYCDSGYKEDGTNTTCAPRQCSRHHVLSFINNIVQSQSSSSKGSSGGGGRANVNKRTEQPKEGKVPSPPVTKSKSDPTANEMTSKDGASAQAQKSSQSASRLQAGKVAAGLGVSVDKTAAKPSNKIRPTAEAVSAMHALVMFSGKAVVITNFYRLHV